MKKLLTLAIFAAISATAWAQQERNDGTLHMLLEKFKPGVVYYKDGLTTSAILNYSVVTQKLVYTQNGDIYYVTNPDNIARVAIDSIVLVPGGSGFMEAIRAGQDGGLYRDRIGSAAPKPKTDSFGSPLPATTNAKTVESYYDFSRLFVVPHDYVVKIIDKYYISRDGNYIPFTTMKEINNAFPGKDKEIKTFLKKTKNKMKTPEEYLAILDFCLGK